MSTEEQELTPFFDVHQRATVEAAMARIIPTDDTPGAREARTIDFLEGYLSGIERIYAKPDGSGFEVLDGKQAHAWERRVDLIREKYVTGLAELDRRSRERCGADFVNLTEPQQDEMLRALEGSGTDQPEGTDGPLSINYGGPVEPALQQTNAEADLDFFPLLVQHTRQGFYADPVYGGNADRVGWQVIGFPGPGSLAEVHDGRYSTIDWFAENRTHPGTGSDDDA